VTASAEVFAELARAPLPVEARAFLAAVFEGEGGVSFRTLFGAGKLLAAHPNVAETAAGRLWNGDLGVFPPWPGAILANGVVTHAAGAGQDQPRTWAAIGELAGIVGFAPQDQIAGNWFLAQHDFMARGGGDLLAALQAGRLLDIPTYLGRVWPGGADARFPKRYAANLAVLSAPPPAPPPPFIGLPPLELTILCTLAPSDDGQSAIVAVKQAAAKLGETPR
jgi:hypothetical protein